jgi:hypothetical protein
MIISSNVGVALCLGAVWVRANSKHHQIYTNRRVSLKPHYELCLSSISRLFLTMKAECFSETMYLPTPSHGNTAQNTKRFLLHIRLIQDSELGSLIIYCDCGMSWISSAFPVKYRISTIN